jgi:hypothetical protein
MTTNPTPTMSDVIRDDQALRYIDQLWELPADYTETKKEILCRLRHYVQQRAKASAPISVHARMDELCTWKSGNEPCENCPRRITAFHMCKLLQDGVVP